MNGRTDEQRNERKDGRTDGRTVRFHYAPNFIWGHKKTYDMASFHMTFKFESTKYGTKDTTNMNNIT